MRSPIVFASLILVIMATSDDSLWAEFKKKHSKIYPSLSEERRRFSIFQSNLRTIEEHNIKYERGQETYYMGMNQFTDMTDKEFQSIYSSHIEVPTVKYEKVFELPSGIVIPDAIDWREKGVVTPVKDQAGCGSCWAFSATGSVESQYVINNGVQVVISEQELIDCSDSHCDGGFEMDAYEYIQKYGISTNESYPYTSWSGVVGTCKKGKDSGVKIIDYVQIPEGEEVLKQAVGLIGPISVHVNASRFSHYAGGILNHPECGQGIDHAMLVVGYGTQGDLDYWIVKNSWSEVWGDHGYVKMARNRNYQCGIGIHQYYPIVQ